MDQNQTQDRFRGFCPACQAESNLSRQHGKADLTVDDQIVTVDVEYLKCLNCGETFDDPQSGDPLIDIYEQIGRGKKPKPAAKPASDVGDYLGLMFFAFATIMAGIAAWEHPTLLAWLSVVHNGLLAVIYTMRRPAAKVDQKGLILGLLAAALPMAAYPDAVPTWLLIPGLAGYALTMWALMALGKSFGIAPADRGLVKRGPYKLVRHPMYLGELVYRCILVGAHLTLANVALLAALVVVQVARIKREERIIGGYENYQQETRWRLLPGIW